MKPVYKEPNVNPEVTLTVDEYNQLVSLAQANTQQIEERAVEYYKKNGVCGIHIDAYVREQNGGCDEIADTFRFDCQPRYGDVKPSDEYEPNPFAIDRETRQRIANFAANYATSVFYRKFGVQLMHINNAERYERRANRNWMIGIVLTLTGWLLSIVLFTILMLK